MSDDASHPSLALDETVHQRVRLGILAVLGEVAECTFTAVREELELTDGNLSRHLRVLEEAGLVQIRKGYEGRRPCTWLGLTRQGHKALRAELAALERLVVRLRRSEAAEAAEQGNDR
ncbi:winged helix-turn-helix domain-containing protein [Rugosimonospora africana]|uniref:Transcriptional regulator n=1 Tax=Rugosimonospora africana TaxID=556532 RepID=A0A8J3VPY8_9ACTN|nr:transcriptional regulator [Rugosimonospora africana]GIH13916.1 transcriptional regulator [Rugosimonospora africana]